METRPTPLTNYQRVRRAKDKAVAAGGKRLPDGILSPPVAVALTELIDSGYGAATAIGVISAALLDAQKKMKINEK